MSCVLLLYIYLHIFSFTQTPLPTQKDATLSDIWCRDSHRARVDENGARLGKSTQMGDQRQMLYEEVTRQCIIEHRAQHFFQQRQLSRSRGVWTHPYIALYPWPPPKILGQRSFATHALQIVHEDECPVCFQPLDVTWAYALGCRHFFHLSCTSLQLVQQARCLICRYDVDLATYWVLSMDDLFLGTFRE